MPEFFGGVPEILVPDHLKSGVNKACRYDPERSPTYQQLAEYYQVVVIPARPGKPGDKPKVEVGVQIAGRWILTRLRPQVFFSPAELNHCIRTPVTEFNERPFKKLPGSLRKAGQIRAQVVTGTAMALPAHQKVKVNIDYHVEYEQHHYPVPHQYVGKTVELHAFDNLPEVWADGLMLGRVRK